jgi:hypothetical protein
MFEHVLLTIRTSCGVVVPSGTYYWFIAKKPVDV